MMKPDEYAEPWNLFEGSVVFSHDDEHRTNLPFVQGSDAVGEFDNIIFGIDEHGTKPLPKIEIKRRMQRAVDCVNAMAGVKDPEAFVRAVLNFLDRHYNRGDVIAEDIDDMRSALG